MAWHMANAAQGGARRLHTLIAATVAVAEVRAARECAIKFTRKSAATQPLRGPQPAAALGEAGALFACSLASNKLRRVAGTADPIEKREEVCQGKVGRECLADGCMQRWWHS